MKTSRFHPLRVAWKKRVTSWRARAWPPRWRYGPGQQPSASSCARRRASSKPTTSSSPAGDSIRKRSCPRLQTDTAPMDTWTTCPLTATHACVHHHGHAQQTMQRLAYVVPVRSAPPRSPHCAARTARARGPSARGGRRLRKGAVRACRGPAYPRSRPSPAPSTSCARRRRATLSGVSPAAVARQRATAPSWRVAAMASTAPSDNCMSAAQRGVQIAESGCRMAHPIKWGRDAQTSGPVAPKASASARQARYRRRQGAFLAQSRPAEPPTKRRNDEHD